MNTEFGVSYLLVQAGIEGVSIHRRPVEDAPECVHVGRSVYEPDARMVGCERGTRRLAVSVCREVERESLEVARACERALHQANWEVLMKPDDDERICSIDADPPRYKGLDSNGRHVYEVAVEITVDRMLP